MTPLRRSRRRRVGLAPLASLLSLAALAARSMADAADAAPTAVEDDVAGAPRPSVSYAQRKESAQRGVPANFIIPSIKYKKDACMA